MMDIDKYFAERCTVRSYSGREVSDELLRQLIDEASHAPTVGNMQLYSVIVSRSTEEREALAPLHFNQPSVMGCSVVLTFCADCKRFVQWCEASDAKPGCDNFQAFMCAVIDTCLFAQQFNTLAEMHGLGCCYLGTTTYNAPQIAEVLGLPELVVPVTTLTVGYPAGEAAESGRLPVEAVMHMGRYCNRTPGEVRDLYAEKEARPDSRQFVAENGKQTLAQVFTDVRYTKAAYEEFSRIYADFIQRHGYPFPKP